MRKIKIPLFSKIALIVSAVMFIAYKVIELLENKGIFVYLGKSTHIIALAASAVTLLLFASGIIVLLCKNLKKVPAIVISAVIGIAAVCFSVITFFFDGSTVYHEFSSPDGKHEIIVCEESFLLGGWGKVYEKSSPITLKLLGNYSTDDGFMPFSSGNYRFEYRDNGFDLYYLFGSGDIEKCISASYIK